MNKRGLLLILGWVLSAISIAYGLSKFLMGNVSDRSNSRVFFKLYDLRQPRGYFGFNSGHGDYTKYYDSDSKKLISEIYSKDIELFGFKFNEQQRKL